MTNGKIKSNLYSCAVAFASVILLVFGSIESRSAHPADVNFFQTNTNRKKTKAKGKTKMNQAKLAAAPTGSWGANGIGIVVEDGGARIEYDCADGEIRGKLMIDGQGNFTANGVHIQQSFGPTRLDNPPQEQPARYTGKISGKTMTLKVVLTETKETVGEYVLEKDKYARIHRCL